MFYLLQRVCGNELEKQFVVHKKILGFLPKVGGS